jgi:hypothetical protein
MKKILTIALIVLTFSALKAQEITNGYSYYLGLDLGFTGNIFNQTLTIDKGEITAQPVFFPSATRRLGFNAGIKKGRNMIELSYQTRKNAINYKYPLSQSEPNLFLQEIIYNDRDLNYFAVRYYRDVFREKMKWKLSVGGGLSFAQFIDSEFINMGGALNTAERKLDNRTINYTYKSKEMLIRENTFGIEGSLKLGRVLNEHFSFNFWGRFILSPWNVRSESFEIMSTDTNDMLRKGSALTNMNSLGLGIGLQYAFK